MKRGEVWWTDFEPAIGGEIRKRRPAVIISNDSANRHLNRAQVVPLTSSIGRFFPSEVAVTLNGKIRKAMTDQITTVSKLRIGSQLGEISETDIKKIEQALRIQLGLLV